MKTKRSVVVILTCKDDPSADYVIEKFLQQGIHPVRINSDEIRKNGSFSWSLGLSGWQISDGVSSLSFGDVGVIWQRRISRRQIAHSNPLVGEYMTQEWRLLWEWWLNTVPATKILDTESALKLAGNKLSQLTLATKIGFTIPETVITSDPKQYQSFVNNHQHVVAKTLGGFGRVLEENKAFGTIYTTRVDPGILPDATSIRAAPIILQEEIPKAYEVRVTVVDQEIFACKIDSQRSRKTMLDWRRYDFANVPHSPHILPDEISDRILQFVKYFGIHFASFDFAVTPTGEYVFFEMNPNSQWVWLEHHAHLPITDALVGALRRRCEL